MSRIRTVKPEWLDDERMALASSPARVLSVGLMLLADDYGRGRAALSLLLGRVFPGHGVDEVREALNELSPWFVRLYEVDGQHYFEIRNWSKHQRVDKPGRPMVPEPSGVPAKVPETPGNLPASRTRARAAPGPDPDPRSTPDPDPGPARDPTESDAETVVPLNLLERADEKGVFSDVVKALPGVTVEQLRYSAGEFMTYWTIGEGMGKRRRHWMAKLREHLRRAFHEKRLKAPGEIEHEARNGSGRKARSGSMADTLAFLQEVEGKQR